MQLRGRVSLLGRRLWHRRPHLRRGHRAAHHLTPDRRADNVTDQLGADRKPNYRTVYRACYCTLGPDRISFAPTDHVEDTELNYD